MNTWTQPQVSITPMRKIAESDYIIYQLLAYVGTTHEFTNGAFQDFWMDFIRDHFDPIDMQHMKEQLQSVENNEMFEFLCTTFRMKYNVKLDLWFKDLYAEFSL